MTGTAKRDLIFSSTVATRPEKKSISQCSASNRSLHWSATTSIGNAFRKEAETARRFAPSGSGGPLHMNASDATPFSGGQSVVRETRLLLSRFSLRTYATDFWRQSWVPALKGRVHFAPSLRGGSKLRRVATPGGSNARDQQFTRPGCN